MTDVIVLGAGFGGLAAARDLCQAGRSVVLLEARDRIGGRTWTKELPGTGVNVEYGGTWFSRAAQPTIAAEIERYGLRVNEAIAPTDHGWVTSDGLRTGIEQNVRWAATLAPVMEALDASRADMEAFLRGEPADLSALDIPTTDWLDQVDAPTEARDLFLGISAAMCGAHPRDASALVTLLDAVDAGYALHNVFTDVGEIFTDGTKSLADAMLADSPNLDLRLSTPARAVEQGPEGVRVITDDGELTVPHVVVALPINVWSDVRFDPPLAPPKQRAATEKHAGGMTKVLANIEGVPEGFVGLGWGTPFELAMDTKPGAVGRIVTGFSNADPIDATNDDAVHAAFHAYLPDAQILAYDSHDWVADEWSKGTWLCWRPGWPTQISKELDTKEGRVWFAGSDVAQESAGWIDGALLSGAKAARGIHQRMEEQV